MRLHNGLQYDIFSAATTPVLLSGENLDLLFSSPGQSPERAIVPPPTSVFV